MDYGSGGRLSFCFLEAMRRLQSFVQYLKFYIFTVCSNFTNSTSSSALNVVENVFFFSFEHLFTVGFEHLIEQSESEILSTTLHKNFEYTSVFFSIKFS